MALSDNAEHHAVSKVGAKGIRFAVKGARPGVSTARSS